MKSFLQKLRGSLVMSLLVAGLAVYTFIDYRKAQNEGTFASDERASFSFRSQDIDYLKIERAQGTVEIHKKEDGQWQMTQPVNDDVEETSALSYLLSLTTQRVRLFTPEDEKQGAVDWSKYGLSPPMATFIAGQSGKKETLSLSSKNAFDGSFYLRQNDTLLIGDTGFAQLNSRTGNSFRSRLLYRDKAPVEKAEVDLEGHKYAVLKKDGRWTIDPAPAYPLDAGKIEAWLERVQEFKPADIVKDELTEEDKRSLLLLVPSAKISLNGNWLLTIGQNRAEDVFLYTDKRPTIYKVSVAGISQVRVPAEFFRDGRKAFEFPVELARTIELKSKKIVANLKKTESGWVTDKNADVSNEAVEFMQALRGLEAKEFGAAKAKTGIASAQILVKDNQGIEIFTLAWGDEYKARALSNNGASFRYARTNLEKETFGLPNEKLEALVRALAIKTGPINPESK